MFGSQILEVGIGLVFVYFIFSMITSAITEVISNILALRARTLEQGLLKLLCHEEQDAQDKRSSVNTDNNIELADKFFNHGLIKNLGRPSKANSKGIPSYLPANRFANALLDLIVNIEGKSIQDRKKLTIEDLKKLITRINNPALRESLMSIIIEVDDDISSGVIDISERLIAVRKKMENWYDEMMSRVSGWYKRKAQKIIFIVALIIAAIINVDTIMVTNILWNAPVVREALAGTANETVTLINQNPGEDVDSAASSSTSDSTTQISNPSLSELQDLQIIGWSLVEKKNERSFPSSFSGWFFKVIGLITTAFALTLGTPFWFDVLSKLVNLRGAGKKPDEQDRDSDSLASIEIPSSGAEGKQTNREVNMLREQVEMLKLSLRNQYRDIVVDKISDNTRLFSLFNFKHRELTSLELQECEVILGSKVNYSEVKVFESNDLPNFLDDIGRVVKDMPKRELAAKNAITLGNCIFFGRDLLTKNLDTSTKSLTQSQINDMSWLIHEMTHVWQFQSRGWEYLWEAWEAQKEMKADAYKYGGESGLRRLSLEGARFHSFNPEQQGQITQDLYERIKKNEELKKSGKEQLDISAYEGFINQM